MLQSCAGGGIGGTYNGSRETFGEVCKYNITHWDTMCYKMYCKKIKIQKIIRKLVFWGRKGFKSVLELVLF